MEDTEGVQLRGLLSQLLLLSEHDAFSPEGLAAPLSSISDNIRLILKGSHSKLVQSSEYFPCLFNSNAREILGRYPAKALHTVLDEYVTEVINNFRSTFQNNDLCQIHLSIVSISLLQTFVQLNFTGPAIDFTARELFFPEVESKTLQLDAIKLLSISGQSAYDLTLDPLFLVISLMLFEELMGIDTKYSLVNSRKIENFDELIAENVTASKSSHDNPIQASIQWWRARGLQVHISLLSEPSGVLSAVSSLVLNPGVVNALVPSTDNNQNLQKSIQLIYHLECARSGIHSQTEHLSIPLLGKARKVSNFNFILTGAKSKRTKFQDFTTAGLVVLAISEFSAEDNLQNESAPENFELNSDLLLERPHYESIDDIELPELEKVKRAKLNEDDFDEEENLLPVAIRKEMIPPILRSLDPNSQPKLKDLDSLQLLLRLTTLKQTSPSNDPLVNEELSALVSRVLYCPKGSVNWSIFSRALWERSILETNKAKTIERGILQMQSLVEELGTNIKTRIIPQAIEDTSSNSGVSSSSVRLRYIHQLTLIPQWSMDATLAEKYMSLGILRSAIEIYERLNMFCEAALCYASVGEENTAEKLIIDRLKDVPDDARAISILGNIRQDPNLWLKAWEVGRYSKAKDALAQYYYKPPPNSGIEQNLDLAIQHLHDSLSINPISYESWFFYGCLGLESLQFELSAEAFTRCVSLDDSNPHAWSNLATSLIRTNKTRESFNALKKAIRCSEDSKKSWRIYENYLIIASKLNEWIDVLIAARELVSIKIHSSGEGSIDIPVVEKLVEILVATDFPKDDTRMTHYQSSCIDFVCNMLPSVITTSARCWRAVGKVELWRQRPWAALECSEKGYRALSHISDLETNEDTWNEAIDACAELVAAYESLGEFPGKHGAGDVVCKDWKYKSRTIIRSLMSKGRIYWEDSKGWGRLQEMKEDLTSN